MDLRDTPEEINRIETYAAIPTDDQISEKLPGLLERASWWDRLMLDTWIPEFTGIIVCSLCLGGIIGLLLTYDNEPLPKFTRGITLNAVVSVLSTASRSLLIFVVAASVGQLKWCWYGPRKRNLHDIQTFDEASRGPLGSVKMLATLRAPLASVAAVITIAALAFDPSLQQLLRYPTRHIPATETPRLVASSGFIYSAKDPRWVNAISAGIWQPAERFAQEPHCATTECKWPVYRSMGWCAKCGDAMSYAKLVNCSFGRAWPMDAEAYNGTGACHLDLGQSNKPQVLKPHYWYGGGYANSAPGKFSDPKMSRESLWVLEALPSQPSSAQLGNNTYLDVRNPVLALGYAHVGLCKVPGNKTLCLEAAQTCVLSPCERELKTSISNGVTSTEVLSINFGDISGHMVDFDSLKCWSRNPDSSPSNPSADMVDTAHSSFCPSNFTDITRGKDTLEIPVVTYQSTLIGRLTGNASQKVSDASSNSDTKDGIAYSIPAMALIASRNLSQVLDGVAASLSALALEDDATSPTIAIEGEAFRSETYVSVDWVWLAIPCSVVIGAILLLLSAVIQSKRHEIKLWKSSILPLLYHGLEPELLGWQYILDDVSAMAKVAEESGVRLANKARADRVVLTSG